MAGEQKRVMGKWTLKEREGREWEAALFMKGLKRKWQRQKGKCVDRWPIKGLTVGREADNGGWSSCIGTTTCREPNTIETTNINHRKTEGDGVKEEKRRFFVM